MILTAEVARTPIFDLETFLAIRNANPNFVMVEFGHGGYPVAKQQPFDFTGERAYIGVEAWMRDPFTEKRRLTTKIRREAGSQNIFFIDVDLKGEVKMNLRASGDLEQWYEGEFDTRTVLPNQVASEVFMSNVFCDPHIAWRGSTSHTERLVVEASRLLAPAGYGVFRETVTPSYVNPCLYEYAAASGLEFVTEISNLEDPTNFELLETIYDPQTYENKNEGFYLIYKKT